MTTPLPLARIPLMIHNAILNELRIHQNVFGTQVPSEVEITIRFQPDGGRVKKVNIRPMYEHYATDG